MSIRSQTGRFCAILSPKSSGVSVTSTAPRFIRPGKPIENAFVESFNGKFRDECLNEHWFASVAEARTLIEAWRVDYNTLRPHSALHGATPERISRVPTASVGRRCRLM